MSLTINHNGSYTISDIHYEGRYELAEAIIGYINTLEAL